MLSPLLYDIMEICKYLTSNDVILEYDVKAAFRHIQLFESESIFTSIINPMRMSSEKYYLVLLDNFAPFGLQSSPLQWGRINGLTHRVQRRLMNLLNRVSKGLVYVDDSTWRLPNE
jgi:hypothetical protein